MKTLKYILAAAALLLIAVWAASPYWALRQIQQGYEQNSAAQISKYIDYEAVKADLQPQIEQRLRERSRLDRLPAGLQAWGGQFSSALSERMAEALVSPQALSLLLQGKDLKAVLADQYLQQLPQGLLPSAASDAAMPASQQQADRMRARYTGWNSFIIEMPEGSGAVSSAEMRRSGFSWKIIALTLAQ